MRNVIGIDPDAKGFVCSLVKLEESNVTRRRFTATWKDVQSFIRWVKTVEDVIVAIEGSNGQSRPIEKGLREAGVMFYSFKPADTDRFRKAVLGQNKNNEKDAESVARYAMALEMQGKLERYRRVWFPDAELQLLTRSYERISQEKTAEMNRLWKTLRLASPDLYLALGGNNPEVELEENVLKTKGILALLAAKPDIGEWKKLSDEQLLAAMGTRTSPARRTIIQELRKVISSFPSMTAPMAMMIGSGAEQIGLFKRKEVEITKLLEEITQGNAAVHALRSMRGIGTITSTTMVAEIIDIRRFAREDSLACYSGLGLLEHSTGDTTRMIHTEMFNHRLKDAFMTAARNYVHFNPDSHLAGYCRNLVKKGMSPLEAYKRVARALVRVIYKKLTSLVESDTHTSGGEDLREGESDMASGVTRSDQSHESDMPLSSPAQGSTGEGGRIKSGGVKTKRRGSVNKRRAVKKRLDFTKTIS